MRILLLAGVLALAGCSGVQVDVAPPTDPNRVVTGTVEVGDIASLPPDTLVTVRVVDAVHKDYHDPTAVLGQRSSTPPVVLPPQVLGEQKIIHPTQTSIPFAVKFYATDDQLSAGLELGARVSFGGKVRYYNVHSYAVNSANIDMPRRVDVNEVR